MANTIPQLLGGKMICENVCDDCNHYFGNISEQLPSIEETFKETFNITRLRLLGKERVGKNKVLAKFKSTYFNVDIHKGKFALKPKFQLKLNFQKVLCRQFKRGVYKVFLEELERQEKEANSFAASLLMPKFMIDEQIENIPNGKDPINHLSEVFKVSSQAMYYRLNNLGYSFLGSY